MMNRMLALIFVLVIVTLPATTQDEADISLPLASVQHIDEVLGTDWLVIDGDGTRLEWIPNSIEPYNIPIISPDGTMIAAETSVRAVESQRRMRLLCIHTLDNALTECYALLERLSIDRYRQYYSYFKWSPDVTRIAFTGYELEPDIWVFDLAAGAFTKMTEDGIDEIDPVRAALGNLDELALDAMPTWGPDGELYFFRYRIDFDLTPFLRLELYRISDGPESVELVSDLTNLIPQEFPYAVFDTLVARFDGFASVNADGTTMALRLMTSSRYYDNRTLIWQVDLNTGEVAPFITQNDMRTGAAVWMEYPNFMPGLQWTNDGNALAIYAETLTCNADLNNVLFADDSGEMIYSVMTYDHLQEPGCMDLPDEDTAKMTQVMPLNPAVLPDGSLLYINNGVLYHVPLGRLPQVVAEDVPFDATYDVLRSSSAGISGDVIRAILGDHLLTLTPDLTTVN